MKVYIEEIEELSAHGVTTYSLVTGMDSYRAEVRASGVDIFERDHYDDGDPLDKEGEEYKQLLSELTKELYKEK